jgi:hypothetical protein
VVKHCGVPPFYGDAGFRLPSLSQTKTTVADASDCRHALAGQRQSGIDKEALLLNQKGPFQDQYSMPSCGVVDNPKGEANQLDIWLFIGGISSSFDSCHAQESRNKEVPRPRFEAVAAGPGRYALTWL